VPSYAWRRLAACTVAAALLQIDGTLITVALPSVGRGIHVSSGSTSVVLSAYFVAYAVLLIPGGILVDRLGSRRVALAGLTMFAIGAAAGALSSTLTPLIVTRVLQGAGAGLVSPAALAGAVSGFPAARRGAALGIWGASAGIANLVGPLLGGLLTISLGWRADWWALVPLALLAAGGIVHELPGTVAAERRGHARVVLNQVVVAATVVAALTFAVMIGSFYLAEQYLQHAAGFSALGASAVLVLVALLVGFAAPMAGRMVDNRGERLTAMLGFFLAAIGLAVLAIPSVSLTGVASLVPLIPVGAGLGLLFVPASRAALNANPAASHGRTSAVLSIGRLLGAGIGAGLAGIALTAGLTASTVHTSLLCAAVLCAAAGIPAAAALGPPLRSASEPALG
jgi:MFS family permease